MFTYTCEMCGKDFQRTQQPRPQGRMLHKFCSRKCAGKGYKRPFNGSRFIGKSGYVTVVLPNRRIIFEHRLVMETILGRPLTRSEIVHHKNEIKTDNHPENLQLTNRKEHRKLHRIHRWARKHDFCVKCRKSDSQHSGKGVCNRCVCQLRLTKLRK